MWDYVLYECSLIDFTFLYTGARGAFDWELYYKRLPLLPEDLVTQLLHDLFTISDQKATSFYIN